MWVWMPHPGHLIVSRDCRFHLNTWVPGNTPSHPGWIVSTVGEYLPDSQIREITAQCRGIELVGKGDAREADYMNKIGYQEIGCDRLYETMVFVASEETEDVRGCCPYRQESGDCVDFAGYNSSDDAFHGHNEMCLKWSGAESEHVANGTDAEAS